MATSTAATGAARRAALLVIPTLVLALALRGSGAAGAGGGDCHFPAVFNFGDSNSDTGGLSSLFGAAPPPNGRTFFGMPSGRYCDGRLVIDFIGGIYRELLPRAEYFSQALYTFDIGQNDITSSYFVYNTTEEVEATIPDLMERLTSVIQSVYMRGGRYFWIHNTGPIGCLPYALLHRPDLATPTDDAGCSVTYNKVAQLFNLRLKETVASLRKTHPDAAFTYVDVYTAKYKLISDAKKLGFDDPLLTCCGHGGGRYNFDLSIGCGGKKEVNGTSVVVGNSCADPSKRVSWDGVHFTEAANKFVFDQIVAGALSDPPVPLKRACQSKGR
nr:unnamed protein product [Digitaria exilis]